MRVLSVLSGFYFVLILLLFFPISAVGYEITLKWNPNSEIDLAGYNLYYGSQSLNYSAIIDVGNVTSYKLSGLEESKPYYFVVTAYDAFGNESSFSKEIFYSVQGITDSDGDGFTDSTEILNGSNPFDYNFTSLFLTTIHFNAIEGMSKLPMRHGYYGIDFSYGIFFSYVPDQVFGKDDNPYSLDGINGGYLKFDFQVEQEGDYFLFIYGLTNNGGNNSFWARINTMGYYYLDLPISDLWLWSVAGDLLSSKDIVSFHLIPGITYTLEILPREDGTKISKIILADNVLYNPIDPVSYYVELMAANAEIQWKMRMEFDLKINDYFVYVPDQVFGINLQPENPYYGYSRFDFQVEQEGDYVFLANVLADNGGNNSFWVQINQNEFLSSFYQWNMEVSKSWQWVTINDEISGQNPVIAHLMSGVLYSLKLVPREDGTKLNRIRVVKLHTEP